MASNAQITVSTMVKVLEDSTEVASRAVSGAINLDEHTEFIDVVAPSTTNKSYSFGAMADIDFISLESDQDISVTFNDTTGETVIDLKAKVTSGDKKTAQLILTASGLTALYITNASVTLPAKVKLVFGKYSA